MNLTEPCRTFRERTEQGWIAFAQGEEELRRLMNLKNRKGAGDELVEKCSSLLYTAFADIAFELGFNGEKYELILIPEGDWAKLFELVYFQRHAPASVLEHWNILVGRQPSKGFGLRSFGVEITAGDVDVQVEKEREGNKISLTMYCEKLLPLLREDEGKALWMLYTLTDQVLGEVSAMALINGFEMKEEPCGKGGISLDDLPEYLDKLGIERNPDPVWYLENCYTAYEMKPDEDPEADWRLDVFAGVTRCPALVNEYLSGESRRMDAFQKEGTVPGFFSYSLSCFADAKERGRAILDFRDALEDAVQKAAGEDAVTFLGGASGIYCGYLDFIAWDLPAVLHAARQYFQDSPVEWANFHPFRRDAEAVQLTERSGTAHD